MISLVGMIRMLYSHTWPTSCDLACAQGDATKSKSSSEGKNGAQAAWPFEEGVALCDCRTF